MLAILPEKKLRQVLSAMLDESEFLSPYGIRALSRFHLDHPYVFTMAGRISAWATCRVIPIRECLAATRTGAARCGCR
jgi:hypothetical protein